jgi:lysyl-tRNA synthetase class I
MTDRFRQIHGISAADGTFPCRGLQQFCCIFSDDFKKTLETLGVGAKYVSSWDMYRAGKFNTVIREALDAALWRSRRSIKRVSGSKKKESGWLAVSGSVRNSAVNWEPPA